MRMQLYRCDNCGAEYVVEDGMTIRCPQCSSKERTNKGEFTVEDINLILEERKNLMEDLGERTKPVIEEPDIEPKHYVREPLDDNPYAEDEEDEWIERERQRAYWDETDERDHGDL